MIHLTLLKFIFFTIALFDSSNCLSCNKQSLRSILRGNYRDVLRLQNGPLITSKKSNSFSGGFDNGIFVRDSIYYVTGGVGYTSCAISGSIIIELRQAYELNTLVFWLWDRSVRTYGLIVYASYEGVETIILDTLATVWQQGQDLLNNLLNNFGFIIEMGILLTHNFILLKQKHFMNYDDI